MNRENKHTIDDLKVNPPQMPSDIYFEDLKKNILNQVRYNGLNRDSQAKIIPLYKHWYIWASAVAILLFAILFSWNNSDSIDESATINLSSVSNEEICKYLNQHIEDMDAETITSHLSTEKFTQNKQQTALETEKNIRKQSVSNTTMFEHIKDEEILDYLKEESGELDEYLLIES
ncbi:hypothetical protein [Fluviicola sp.]|jgi:hypothetical protein|uniref:hypothetical protein n=1 Tax=Fluviicola sp. TaxID=1917219 RepID=UPI0028279B6D|nr:hypothetical protein [Fluviicola sp.]MDR0803092.1 hypothetical protein [Fluviicola sp.]